VADLDGVAELESAMAGMAVQVDAATGRGLTQAVHHLEGQIKQLLSLTSHKQGTPTPSAPGSPPSLVTGQLRRSIQVEGPSRSGIGQWSAKTSANTVYAAVQERGGNHLPARPYMAPALAAALPAMGQLIEQAWAAALET
jgi:hypothetical protein